MKKCSSCGAPFEPNRHWQKYCNLKCQRNNPIKAKRNAEYQQSRRDLINQIKLDAGCAHCGYAEHPAALDFNHVRGDKKFNVSQDPKVALQKLLAEIAKCEVLCANCHRIVTHEGRHWHSKRKGKNNG